MKRTICTLLFITAMIFNLTGEEKSVSPSLDPFFTGPMFWHTAFWLPAWATGNDFAMIGPESWQRNLTNEWKWDHDPFYINYIGHTYQGSLCYGTVRGSGWDFLGGCISAVSSSITWELFMETGAPRKNDFLMTSVGGSALGEMLFRISVSLKNDDSRGINEPLSILMSPGGRMGSLIYKNPLPEKSPSMMFHHYLTANVTNNQMTIPDGGDCDPSIKNSVGLQYNFNMKYGDLFYGKFEAPYDTFYVRGNVGIMHNDYEANIFTEGAITGMELYTEKNAENFLGFFLHYDFMNDRALTMGANSLGIGWVHRYTAESEREVNLAVHAAWNIINSTEFRGLYEDDGKTKIVTDEEKDHNLGTGENIKISLELLDHVTGSLKLESSTYFSRIIDESVAKEGSDGKTFVNYLRLEMNRYLSPSFGIQTAISHEYKKADYSDLPDIEVRTRSLQLGIIYRS